MAEMIHEIAIAAPVERVFAALTAATELRQWWTTDSVAEPIVGTVAEFGFGNRSTVFRMRVAQLESPHRLVWECLGDPDEWAGTTLTWDIKPEEQGSRLRFVHSQWQATDGMFAFCNSTWGELMFRLRRHLEGESPGPLFPG